jgi:two-component system, sensor histidine kinase LadS
VTLIRSILLLLAWCCSLPALALTLQASDRQVSLARHVQVLEDPGGQLTLEQVSSPPWSARFQPASVQAGELNFAYTKSAYWLRIPMQRDAGAPLRWILELPFVKLGEVDFYEPGQPAVLTGSSRPLESRPLFSRYYVFPLSLQPHEQAYYLRVRSRHAVAVPLKLWQREDYTRHQHADLMLQYLYFGGLLVLVIYNFMVGCSLRDARFVWYALFGISLGAGFAASSGLGRLWLWPDWPEFDEVSQTGLLSLAAVFFIAFAQKFLDARRRARWLYWLMNLSAALFLLLVLALFLSLHLGWDVRLLNVLIRVNVLALGVPIFVACLRILFAGDRTVRYFLLAWVVLWSGVIVAALRNLGWVPTNAFTTWVVQIASAGEMLLLSLALAEIIHAERRARELAQEQALEASRRSGERLEAEVHSRTEELQVQAEQLRERGELLERSLATEKQVLAQYVRFGSMISHEFRNPLAVIDSQLRLLGREHEQGKHRLEERLPVAQRAVSRLATMFEQWLKSDRIGQSLQDISPHAIPLRPWLEHLVEGLYCLSQHRIELQLDPGVEQVVADDHLLEIALGNLVENASKYAPAGSLITLQTRGAPGRVGIAVIDQGPGIAPEHQRAVFEDFYRVQPEGRIHGMGLGLSIVQRIAQAHGGELTLQSESGQGCCFCIWLPAQALPRDEK